MSKSNDDKPAVVTGSRSIAAWEIGALLTAVLLLVAGFLYEYDRLGNAATRSFDRKAKVVRSYAEGRLQDAAALAARLRSGLEQGRGAGLAGVRQAEGQWTLAAPGEAARGVASGPLPVAALPSREVGAALALEAEAAALLAGDSEVSAVWYLSANRFRYLHARAPDATTTFTEALYQQAAWIRADPAHNPAAAPFLVGSRDPGGVVTAVAPVVGPAGLAGVVGLELDPGLLQALLDNSGVPGDAVLVDGAGQVVAAAGAFLPGETLALPSADRNYWTDDDSVTWSALALADGQLWLLYRTSLGEHLGAALARSAPLGLALLLLVLLVILVVRHREAMEQVALHERRDPLTHALNRLGLFEEAVPLRALARRNQKPVAVLVLDVDYFRQLNEQFGHAVGDKVLRALTAGLKEKLREYDELCRWSGEVFVVLLMVEAEADAWLVAERLRGIAAAACHRDALLKVTVSGGLVMLPPEEKLEHGIGRAEEMLYAAKAAGRDRLVAGPDVPLPGVAPGPGSVEPTAAPVPDAAETADAAKTAAALRVEAIPTAAPPEGTPDPLDPAAAYRRH